VDARRSRWVTDAAQDGISNTRAAARLRGKFRL
jgi:hypothetical protein